MAFTLEEFRKEYLEDVKDGAVERSVTPNYYFLETALERLESLGDIEDPRILRFYALGRNRRAMEFDAYAYDEYDKSISLFFNDYVDSSNVENLNAQKIDQMVTKMLNFLEEVYDNTLYKYVDPSLESYQVGKEMHIRLMIDKIDFTKEEDRSIERIKLFILTNAAISSRYKTTKLDYNFHGRQIELNIWSIERFYEIASSGREREAIHINVEDYGYEGIPCIKADMEGVEGYDSYLAIVPGELLHKIYWEYGSSLLEGNVRAFLSTKGGVNRGIRETIIHEPSKFFVYNNGIACTAKSIKLSKDGRFVLEMEDLQIINGGQTTASLTSTVTKDKVSLRNIYVQMKLSVIKDEQYEDMIQKISKYSNSQNKVTDADLFSNHAFHRKFEELSEKCIAPVKRGEIHGTYWFYERARGKYEQAQFKLLTPTQKKEFAKRRPKKQIIKKEELAKYYVAANLCRPDFVSLGSQKNMKHFAAEIDKKWKAEPKQFNDAFYHQAIGYAILFRELDKLILTSDWYRTGGYKLNIIPYTIAKLVSTIPDGYSIDYNSIWRNQTLYPSLVAELRRLAPIANDFIVDSHGVIPTEYAKKKDTWEKFKNVPFKLSAEFVNTLIKTSLLEQHQKDQIQEEKEKEAVNIEIEIFTLCQAENGKYWDRLLVEAEQRGILDYKERELLKFASKIITSGRTPSPSQAKIIWSARKKLEDVGVLILPQ